MGYRVEDGPKREETYNHYSSFYDLDLEDRNPNFLYDTPGHDKPTYQVLSQKVLWFRRYRQDKYPLRI